MSPADLPSFNETVGANLRRLRTDRGLSQAKLAAQITERGAPLTQTLLARVENGVRKLQFEEALHAAAILKVDVAVLADSARTAMAVGVTMDIKFSVVDGLEQQIRQLRRDLELAEERRGRAEQPAMFEPAAQS